MPPNCLKNKNTKCVTVSVLMMCATTKLILFFPDKEYGAVSLPPELTCDVKTPELFPPSIPKLHMNTATMFICSLLSPWFAVLQILENKKNVFHNTTTRSFSVPSDECFIFYHYCDFLSPFIAERVGKQG